MKMQKRKMTIDDMGVVREMTDAECRAWLRLCADVGMDRRITAEEVILAAIDNEAKAALKGELS